MKKIILSMVFAMGLTLPVHAGMLGLDWEATGEYNMDSEVTALSAQVGKTWSMNDLSVSVDADWDLDNTSFEGVDWKVNYGLAANLDAYVKSGMTSDWANEDIVAGITFSW